MTTNITWRYLAKGNVKHAMCSAGHTGHDRAALCGAAPHWLDPASWMGTGSPNEYERLDELPECLTCAKLLRIYHGRGGHVDE